MEMHFFLLEWFLSEDGLEGALAPGDDLTQTLLLSFVSGEVTPNSLTQGGSFKNRTVPCRRPSQGEAWALICCLPAGARAVPVFLWLLSSSQTWLCKGCSSWGRKRDGKGNLTGKRLQSPLLLFILSFPCSTNICTFGVGSTKRSFASF